MKKMFKKLLSLSLACAMLLSMGVTAFATEKSPQQLKEINLFDVYNNPEKYPDIEIIVHETIDDYIEVVSNDSNLPLETKAQLIADAKIDARSRASYQYLTFKATVTVTSTYKCYPYIYVKCEMLGVSPSAFVEVKSGNIDRKYNGISKQFAGSLYYNLETDSRLYWDLNGDFYNNGSTSISAGVTVPVGGVGSTNFSASMTSNHYEYVNDTGVFTI